MRNLEVPLGGLPAADVFNSSTDTVSVPIGAQILYAELFWAGSLLVEPGDVGAQAPNDKGRALLSVGDEDCSAAGDPCEVTSKSSDVVQETLGSVLGQYRASAVVTSRLQDAQWTVAQDSWQSQITVGNIQTSQGVDKAAGWSLAVVFASPGHEMRHVQVLGGFGFVARRSGATIPLDGFVTPSSGDVSSAVGLVAFDGDLGDTTDSMYLRQDSGQTIIEDAQNPELNVANSTISNSGALSPYLTDASVGRSSNTFGVDADRIDLSNALGHGSTQATLVMSTQQDTWYPAAMAYSTQLPSADVQVLKYVSDVTGAPSPQVNTGDALTYTLRLTNAGNASASSIVVRDEIPDDLTLTSSSGTDCPTIPAGYICKVIDTLAAGAFVDITLTGTVNGSSQLTTGSFTNQAEVTYSSHLGSNIAISNTVTTDYGPLAIDLMSTLAFADNYIQAGDETVLRATITNLGPVSDEDPSTDLLVTQGVAKFASLPTGCSQSTGTRIRCAAVAFGVSATHPLDPGESKTLQIHLRPDSGISQLVMKQVVHTGVAVGDSNPSNNVSYAHVAINHPPTATPIRISAHMGGTAVTVSMASHISDPDGDALHIRVARASHGKLLQLGTRLNYTPPTDWSGVEQVKYTVSDGKGGQSQSHITIVVTQLATTGGDASSGTAPTHPRRCFVIRTGC
jgi:uncharacterized repeat protein (TIGR01451 family)